MSVGAKPLVKVEYQLEGCALVKLTRPAAKNTFSAQLRRDLVALFDEVLPTRTRVVVLAGERNFFCAGLDLRELGATTDSRELISRACLDVACAVHEFNGPVIGAVNGPALTGDFELALACDVLLASESATFADTHARVGVLPKWGLSLVLPRRIGDVRSKKMSMTGNYVGAQKALKWGLVNHVVGTERLLPAALALAGDTHSALSEMFVAYKSLIDDGHGMVLVKAMELKRTRSFGWSAGLTAAVLESRRRDVFELGRARFAVVGA